MAQGSPAPQLPTTAGWRRRRVYLAGGVLGCVFLGWLVWTLQTQQTASQKPPPPRQPLKNEVTGKPSSAVALMQGKEKQTYIGVDRTEKTPQPVPEKKPDAAPLFPVTHAALPEVKAPPPPEVIQIPPLRQEEPRTVQPAVPSPPKTAKGTATPTPQKWSTTAVPVGKPPVEDGPVTHDAPEKDAKGGSALVKPAQWVKPRDTTRVLYPSQVMHAILSTAINSDTPGDVLMKITRPVYDIHQTGVLLIPQHTWAHATMDGSVKYGDKRIKAEIRLFQLPDGSLLSLAPIGVADPAGAAGIPARVNNHWPEVIAGSLISATLSVGARMAGGNGGGSYQASPELEVSRAVSQDINRTGQEIVRRSLQRQPTLMADEGDPVTFRVHDAVSLKREPKPVD